MTDFSHLDSLDIKNDKRAEYVIERLAGFPVLYLAPADGTNKPLLNATLKLSRRTTRLASSKSLSAKKLDEIRDVDKTLYADHVIKGWKGIKDSQNNDVEFTPDNVKAFLNAIPDWMFDDIKRFASNLDNFIDEVPDMEETAKN